MDVANKNLTITLTKQDQEDLEYLVEYFQDQSISTVTKSDVIKFMINQTRRTIEQDLLKQVNNMIKESEQEEGDGDK